MVDIRSPAAGIGKVQPPSRDDEENITSSSANCQEQETNEVADQTIEVPDRVLRTETQIYAQNDPAIVDHSNMILGLAAVGEDTSEEMNNEDQHRSHIAPDDHKGVPHSRGTTEIDKNNYKNNSKDNRNDGNDGHHDTFVLLNHILDENTIASQKEDADTATKKRSMMNKEDYRLNEDPNMIMEKKLANLSSPHQEQSSMRAESSNYSRRAIPSIVGAVAVAGVGRASSDIALRYEDSDLESIEMTTTVLDGGGMNSNNSITSDDVNDPITANIVDEDDLEQQIKEKIMNDAATANVVEDKLPTPWYHKRSILSLLCVVIIVIVIAITVATTTNKDDSNHEAAFQNTENSTILVVKGTVDQTMAPSSSPTLSESGLDLLDFLIESFPASNTSLSNETSPQYQAFLWLASSGFGAKLNDATVPPTTILKKFGQASFYYAMNGENWINKKGWLEVWEPCQQEIEVDHREVVHGLDCATLEDPTRLDLSTNNLKGTIPPETLLFASKCAQFDLSGNLIEGSLPTELYSFERLKILKLSSNKMTGTLSDEIRNFKSFEELDLEFNHFTGSLPTTIGSCTHLHSIVLEESGFTGSIPSEIGRLTHLKQFKIRATGLSGSVPEEIGNLASLTHLDISHSRDGMNGTIPEGLYELTNLHTLQLSNIGLYGSISSRIGALTSLETLDCVEQALSGTFPTEIGLLTNLEFFRFHGNHISGSLPTEIGLMTKLKGFPVQRNRLSGTLPTEIGNLGFVALFLQTNRLTGTIPSELYNLRILNLIGNHLSGTIPPALFNNTRMQIFDAGRRLEGTIPTTIGRARSLRVFKVHSNRLTGTIPTEIASMKELREFAVADNMLTGTLPTEMGNLTLIVNMYLQRNMFSGQLPGSIFSSGWETPKLAYFHGNNFSGSLDSFCDSSVINLFAGCGEVSCPCCTYCCNSTGGDCEWTGFGEEGEGEQRIKGSAPR